MVGGASTATGAAAFPLLADRSGYRSFDALAADPAREKKKSPVNRAFQPKIDKVANRERRNEFPLPPPADWSPEEAIKLDPRRAFRS